MSKASDKIPSRLNIQCQLDLQLSKEGSDKLPTFRIVANTGKPMQLAGFYDPVIVDLAGVKFARKTTPILMDHDSAKRIGHTTRQAVNGLSNIEVEGIVSSSMNVAQGFVQDARNGFPFQASIGAEIQKGVIYLEEGATAEVNGKTWKGPLIISKKTKVYEVSITALGADEATRVKVSAKHISLPKVSRMDKEFSNWLESMGFKPDDLTEDQAKNLKTQYEETEKLKAMRDKFSRKTPPPLPGSDVPEDDPLKVKARLAALEEKERIVQIKAVAAKPEYRHLNTEDRRSLEAKAIEEKWTPEHTDLIMAREAIEAVTPKSNFQTSGDNVGQILECSLARSLGVPESVEKNGKKFGLEHWYSDQVLEASQSKQFRAISLHQLMAWCIQAAGMHYVGSYKSDEFLDTFLHANLQLKASGFSTLAVSNILENVANKSLLAAYQSQGTVWDQFCGVKSLSDFKQHSYYRLTVSGGYAKVGADGELKHGQFSDQKFTLQGDTYGMILALTRRDMINDDLSAFDQIPTALGRLAALAIELAVFDLLLLNTGTFFGTGNANYIDGADSDMDIAGVGKASLYFRNQVYDGKPLLTAPDRVLVGAQDEAAAFDVYQETSTDVHVGSTAGKKFPKRNPYRGLYRPIVSAILNNTNIKKMDGTALSNQDGNQWYMFCDPAVLACFLVGFLNGVRVPVIESAETDFTTLGMQWRSYHDWGIGQGDPKGGVKSKGTA